MERCDVAIVGAGPYGLSAAAHLRHVKGLDVRLFGEPMSFWERHMPQQMTLRSPWAASHLSDPAERFTLDGYRDTTPARALALPLRVTDFIEYGHWFHKHAAVPADPTKVLRIEPASDGYLLGLETGHDLRARRVVVAGGVQPFAHRPDLFRNMPVALATHTSEQRDFERFRGKEVVVVGAGQSALEAAAFLNEAGARVEVLIRDSVVRWPRQWTHCKAIGWMLYGKGDVGPAGVSLVVQRPLLFRQLPPWVQAWWGRRAIRPSVLPRLRPRTKGVSIRTGRYPVDARVAGERVRLRLNDGTERVVDHVVLGTGYRVDVARYPFLTPRLLEYVDRVDGYPRLDRGFETSSPGLHVLGAPAAWSFGPLMRFVAGAEFTARMLAQRIAGARRLEFASSPQIAAQPQWRSDSRVRADTV